MPDEFKIIDEREPSAIKDPDNLSWGIALVAVGMIFLVNTLGIIKIPFTNWWAIFFLVPGINLLTRAWYYYREHGSLSRHSSRSALWGSVLVLLAFTFFFNLNLTLLFPFVLIGAGLYLLLSR